MDVNFEINSSYAQRQADHMIGLVCITGILESWSRVLTHMEACDLPNTHVNVLARVDREMGFTTKTREGRKGRVCRGSM